MQPCTYQERLIDALNTTLSAASHQLCDDIAGMMGLHFTQWAAKKVGPYTMTHTYSPKGFLFNYNRGFVNTAVIGDSVSCVDVAIHDVPCVRVDLTYDEFSSFVDTLFNAHNVRQLIGIFPEWRDTILQSGPYNSNVDDVNEEFISNTIINALHTTNGTPYVLVTPHEDIAHVYCVDDAFAYALKERLFEFNYMLTPEGRVVGECVEGTIEMTFSEHKRSRRISVEIAMKNVLFPNGVRSIPSRL